MSLTPGTRLEPYPVTALLGAGGMGEVYRAHDTRLQRDVAVKVLPPALASDPDRLARFGREARAAAALNHPGITAVSDVGTHGGAPFLVSELLDGETHPCASVLLQPSALAAGALQPVGWSGRGREQEKRR